MTAPDLGAVLAIAFIAFAAALSAVLLAASVWLIVREGLETSSGVVDLDAETEARRERIARLNTFDGRLIGQRLDSDVTR